MGKRAVLIVSVKNWVCAYRDQLHAASQQKAASHFALLWDKPTEMVTYLLRELSGKM
jgi:hypothetical protein